MSEEWFVNERLLLVFCERMSEKWFVNERESGATC